MSVRDLGGLIDRRGLGALLVTFFLVATALVGARPSAAAACDELFTDPAGDALNTAEFGDEENVDNLDILSGGIVAETAATPDTPATFTTEIKIANLHMKMPENATANLSWYFQWDYDGTRYYSVATRPYHSVTGQPILYSFGTYEPPRFVKIADTTGEFNEGKEGTVRVHVPLELVGAPTPGAVFTNSFANTRIGQGAPTGSPSVVTQIDRAPDDPEAFGANYPLGTCQGGGGGLRSPGPRLRVNDDTPKRGSTVRARASLKECPGHAGTRIQLQRRKGGQFKTIATKKLNEKCRARFKIEANFKRATFRSKWAKQDADHRAGQSKRLVLRTHR